jgi:raffinose/stachyose/melibiose transport system permease protein
MGTLRFRPSVLLFMLPAFALYGVFFVFPFVRTLYFSFFEWNGFSEPLFVGLANYAELLHDELFLRGVGRAALWALLAVLLKVGSALMLASMLRVPIPGSRFFTTAFFVPVVISSAAISLMFTLIYDLDVGLLNSLLRGIGLASWTRSWLGDENTALLAVIAVPVWHTIGYFLVILLAAMQGVPKELYESAEIDGAGRWAIFSRITVPMVWATLQVCVVLAITAAFKSFDYVFVMTRGGPGTSTQVPATYMYETIFVGLKFGYGTTIATAIFLIGLVTTITVRRLTRSRMH